MKLTQAEKKRLKLAQTQEKTRASKVKTELYNAKTKEKKAKAKLHKTDKKRKSAGKGISFGSFFK